MRFSAKYLKEQLALLPKAKRYLVGFSGGLDSQVLLHALSDLQQETPIVAVHINHSIQDESAQWQADCERTANTLKVSFIGRKVDGLNPQGESPEAWARNKRYAAFSDLMQTGDTLLLAHHQDDQVETFFLQLLRGSGPSGLASMPVSKPFVNGLIARPLLDVTRKELEAYAATNNIDWVEDPSNENCRYDRNYLRHEVLPLLNKRWPSYKNNISRSIRLQADACEVIDASAAEHYEKVVTKNNYLSVSKLQLLSDLSIRNTIRFWIQKSGFQLPSIAQLRQIIDTVLTAANDRIPCVAWSTVEVRRYRDELILMPALVVHDPSVQFDWQLNEVLTLPAGQLLAIKQKGKGLKLTLSTLQVRFRQGGEVLLPAGKKHKLSLKSYLQEQGVYPWMRDRIPLLYYGDELVAVVGLCVVDAYSVDNEQYGWIFEWNETGGANRT